MAIDPKELRIGSHVEYDDRRCIVVGIADIMSAIKGDIALKCDDEVILNADLNLINPISITKELLTELGFEWNGTSYSKEYAKDSYVVIFPHKTIESFRVILHPKDSRRHMDFLFEYLHELESLYYHCTKQELIND